VANIFGYRPYGTHTQRQCRIWDTGQTSVLICKAEGLWQLTRKVPAEDTRRVDVFSFTCVVLPTGHENQRDNVDPCVRHLAQLVRDVAAAFDAAAVLAPPLQAETVEGLDALFLAAKLPELVASSLRTAGAAHVKELGPNGWAELAPWARLHDGEVQGLAAHRSLGPWLVCVGLPMCLGWWFLRHGQRYRKTRL